MRVSAAGGTPQTVTSLDSEKGEFSHRWPEFLPGGKAVIFTVGTVGNWDDAQIVAQWVETGQRKVLVQGGTHARYVPTGHLVYARAGRLMAVPFDLARLEVTDAPVPIVEGVMQSTQGAAQFSFSTLGSLVYVPGTLQVKRTLVWVDRRGTARPLVSPPRPYWQPRLSPDGRRLAVYIEEGKNDVWVCDLAVGTFTRLTFEANNWNPLWTPDGKRVTFQSTRAGAANLFWRAADGSAAEERLTTSPYTHYPHSWEGAGLLREPSHDGIGHLGAPSRWGAQATPFPPNAVS
ncbi:MAG: PD40 domain-containing protein [Acidobacteria bacterium]|nr:PD40 domain-containing protein [Acidobacteriota bacterium]